MEDQSESFVTITKHAISRIKERVGIKNSRGQIDIAENAFRFGVRCVDAVGAERKYIESRIKDEPKYANRDIRLYRDILFVFVHNILITVLPPDKTFCKKLQANRRKKNQSNRDAA